MIQFLADKAKAANKWNLTVKDKIPSKSEPNGTAVF
jgi:hypothetical protein